MKSNFECKSLAPNFCRDRLERVSRVMTRLDIEVTRALLNFDTRSESRFLVVFELRNMGSVGTRWATEGWQCLSKAHATWPHVENLRVDTVLDGDIKWRGLAIVEKGENARQDDYFLRASENPRALLQESFGLVASPGVADMAKLREECTDLDLVNSSTTLQMLAVMAQKFDEFACSINSTGEWEGIAHVAGPFERTL